MSTVDESRLHRENEVGNESDPLPGGAISRLERSDGARSPVPVIDPHAPKEAMGNRHVREGEFALKHPRAALAVGRILDEPAQGLLASLKPTEVAHAVERAISGGTNLSTEVRNIASGVGLNESSTGRGTEVNAFRHVLWQAMITIRMGAKVAREVGYSHEDDPTAMHDVRSLANALFVNDEGEDRADSAVDLANNTIGRELGASFDQSATIKQVAIAVLKHFHKEGLWMVGAHRGGYFQPAIQRLSDDQFQKVSARVDALPERDPTARLGGR